MFHQAMYLIKQGWPESERKKYRVGIFKNFCFDYYDVTYDDMDIPLHAVITISLILQVNFFTFIESSLLTKRQKLPFCLIVFKKKNMQNVDK